MAVNPPYPDAAAAEKLALTLAGSLLLHFALIFGLQIRAVPAASPPGKIIQARLVEAPLAVTASVPEVDGLRLQVAQTVTPLPLAAEPAPAAVAPEPMQAASAAVPENNAQLPSIEVPLIEDPTYYPAKAVDVHPTALQAIQPFYPDEAVRANVSGSVVLLLFLDEGGKVRELSVEEANPPGLFDQSALDAFRNARFTPAQRQGRTVKSRVRIKVNYELMGKHEPIDKTKQ